MGWQFMIGCWPLHSSALTAASLTTTSRACIGCEIVLDSGFVSVTNGNIYKSAGWFPIGSNCEWMLTDGCVTGE
ncbi:hypothetical protein BO82DRAFT_352282 [Aspergillus uvarum CBS 121591]|uniref:CUB domain-containing protein n=1 Tax=Aspergillus uvarum CBS 121591 TaxID=1448315 RepID=A0A319CIZ2_9EURO|nr:hypothetical protein BO82DRAFT_352282 [Aspergillus uvarum CBS 121591]PYH84299.1 hypothetical protein BO82DRAFT_352282 [Aspergillus uvarum CBS 121591]